MPFQTMRSFSPCRFFFLVWHLLDFKLLFATFSQHIMYFLCCLPSVLLPCCFFVMSFAGKTVGSILFKHSVIPSNSLLAVYFTKCDSAFAQWVIAIKLVPMLLCRLIVTQRNKWCQASLCGLSFPFIIWNLLEWLNLPSNSIFHPAVRK